MLFHDVIQIFALANLDAFVLVSVVLLDGRRIGAALVDIDQARFAIGADGFVQKSARRFLITLGSKQDVE